jgi:cation diffusion facilitator CzcD-associated flavoprotein CzcO
LNPNWSQKFSLRSEIQQYFRNVTEQYNLFPHIHFRTTVERAQWDENAQHWEVTLKNQLTKEIRVTRCRILVSGVGSLSIPRKCELPGADTFNGPLFHSAQWDPNFDWTGKNIVVIGNGCSATQFVPIMAETAGQLTQFARQSHYLAERPNPGEYLFKDLDLLLTLNPVYSPTFQVCMKYIPLAMRLYRLFLYAEMEKDFAGFDMQGGASIRRSLADENARYVRRMAPEKYHDVLIPHHEIGCKRKVMDTDYLVTLHRPNVELIAKDPVLTIDPTGVRTHNGRHVPADAIVLATGFQVFRMLFPMEIIGVDGRALQDYWDDECGGAAQAYFGTSVPGFPNFFVLMGPNTVTGHLSVIYTVECQIGYILRLIEPILRSRQDVVTSVDVKKSAAVEDSRWTQDRLKKMVWASGCTSWALDPKTGLNIA